MSGRLQDDRGLHYGDGLFETIRFRRGRAPLWELHLERLLGGCRRLALPAPDADALARRTRRRAGVHAHSVVKLIYSAGSGPRGYARPQAPVPRLLVLVSAWQPPAARALRVRWCQTRLALQPALAGIKHLNRLEQVLARAEWREPTIDEGLMLDTEGHVIAATAANLFVRQDGRWLTPPVDRCGVAGVARRWMIDQVAARECQLTRAAVEAAELCVLTNALHGPRQIGALAGQRWPADGELRALRRAWNAVFADRAGGR